MKKLNGRTILVAAVVLFSLNISAVAEELTGTEWRPAKIGDVEFSNDSGIFIRFEGDGRITGNGGCNGFFGSYRLADHTIGFDHLGATRKACPQPVMDRESLFMKALEDARTFVRDETGLTLTDGTGKASVLIARTE